MIGPLFSVGIEHRLHDIYMHGFSADRLCQSHSNLMAKDDFKNLGFKEETKPSQDDKSEKGVKGELRW